MSRRPSKKVLADMLQEDKAAQTPFRTIYNDGGVANSQSPSDDA